MPRLKQVPLAEADPEMVQPIYRMLFGDRDPVTDPGTSTGTPGDWWTVFANSPEAFQHAVQGFAYYRSPKRKLDPVLRTYGQTLAGFITGSQFVFSQQCKTLRGLGVAEEKIAALPAWAAANCFDENERTVLAYCDSLVGHQGRVPDALFEQLKSILDDEQILELTYITSMYLMHAVMSRALRTEFDDRDDPIVEVDAPEDFSASEFVQT